MVRRFSILLHLLWQFIITAEELPMRHPGFLLCGVALASSLASSGGQSAVTGDMQSEASINRSVDSILARLTLEQKVGQLAQYSGGWTDSMTGPGQRRPDLIDRIRAGTVGSIFNATGAQLIRQLQEIAVTQSPTKIPLLIGLDVIHGFRTTFPVPLAEASSWDPDAVYRSARVAATEAAASGIHWTFAPMVDIARDPRWGRIVEGSGEDPYLGAAMASARVRGFQTADLASPFTIMACPKHFAAYGGAEGGRDYNTVDITERTLREVYLPPFKAAVDAGAGTTMCSFNEIGGIPSTANRQLLTDILRTEWGFRGFVVSDWGSIGELQQHGIAGTLADAARLSITAGTDMDMESDAYWRHLADLVKAGTVPESVIDEAVRRVLRVKYRLGLFDNPYRWTDADIEKAMLLHPDHLAIARDMARKSIVLLKNENQLLPLRKDLPLLAVIGPLAADNDSPLGPWAAHGRADEVVTLLDGITEAVARTTRVGYARGCSIDTSGTEGFAAALGLARRADAVILALGEGRDMSGEASCRSSLDLPGSQQALLEAVVQTGKPVVLVLMNGRPLSIAWAAGHVPAIVEGWYLGTQTGNALADVIFGDYNPSGRLPVSVPRTVGQVPVYYNHKNTGRPGDTANNYTSKYLDLPLTPLYPFGFGLSYTTFAYDDLRLSAATISTTDSVHVTVRVRNAGKRAGEEVVQLYIRDDVASVTRPVMELKGFRKIPLTPGQSREVDFVITPDHLAFYDQTMQYRVEPGTFTIMVGPHSAQVQSRILTVR
ncbi:MAG: beta-glucosidase [Bacteroidetes bacterium]|nr:beta-glucosidase [Bacteroidota bacterium]